MAITHPTLGHLKPESPLYWVCDHHTVHLLSPLAIMIELPDGSTRAAFLADPRRFTSAEAERIAHYLSDQGQGTVGEARAALLQNAELPILADHISGVSFDGRLIA